MSAPVRQRGPDSAEGAAVAVVVPTGARVVAAEPDAGTCTSPDPGRPDLVVCAFGGLTPGARAGATITVTVDAVASGTLVATGVADAQTSDPDASDNVARVDVTVVDATG